MSRKRSTSFIYLIMINFGHYVTLAWGQILTLTFRDKVIISFESSLREKYDDAIADSLSLLVQRLYVKEYFACFIYFDNMWPIEAYINHWPEVTFDEDLIDRRVQKLSIGISCVLLAITVHDATARLLKNIITSIKLWSLMTSGDPNIVLREKMTKIFFLITFWELSNVFYRVLTLLVFWVTRGGYNDIPPPPHYGEVGWGRHWGAG